MEIDAEMRQKILVSVVAVGAFILLIVGLGFQFDGSSFGQQGGLALLVSIVGFTLLMAGVGVWLSR
jgi:hypothetical protein